MYFNLAIFLALFLTGCSVGPKTTYIEYQKEEPIKHYLSNAKKKTNGVIKGTIEKISLNENSSWEYEVKGVDTKNAKLDFAQFTYSKKIANKGSLIYATIKNGVLSEYFILSSKGQIVTKEVSKPQKRTKKRQVLEVPQSETILLD